MVAFGGNQMGFLEDLAAAKQVPRPTADVPVDLNGHSYRLRFTQMNGWEWANETAKHPALPGVLIDSQFGYNLNGLVRAVAPRSGALLDGDATVPVDDWDDLFDALPGSAVQQIINAVFSLNEYSAAQAVEAAKKALRRSGKTLR